MATVSFFKRLALPSLLIVTLVSVVMILNRVEQVEAAATDLPLPAMSDFIIYSDGGPNTWAYYIPLNQFPKDPFSNWSAGWCKGNSTRSLPILPYLQFVDYEGIDYIKDSEQLTEFILDDRTNKGYNFNKNGAYRNTVGSCETNLSSMGVQNANTGGDRLFALTALRSAGVCEPGIWEWDPDMSGPFPCKTPTYKTYQEDKGVDRGGYSVSPNAFNGWATNQTDFDYNTPYKWYSALEVYDDLKIWNTGAKAKANGCLDYKGLNTHDAMLNGTEWVRKRMLEETDIYDGLEVGGVSQLKTISGNQCHIKTDYFTSMYSPGDVVKIRKGLNQLIDDDTVEPWDYMGLYSNGLTLYRQEFSLSSEQLEIIEESQAANSKQGGLFIDLVADDFYTVYVNGCKITSNVWNSAMVQQIVIPYEYLNHAESYCGDTDPTKPNLLAIEVIDRIVVSDFHDNNGTGLGFIVGIRNFDRYTLTTNSKCGAGSGASVDWTTTYVLAGGEVTCEHTVTKKGSSPPILSTTERWVACNTYDSAGNLKSTGPSACELSLQVDTSLNTVFRTFVIPNDGAYQPGDEVCTSFGYIPSTVSMLPGGDTKSATNPDGSFRSTESTPACITIADAAAFAPRPHSYFFGGDVFSHSDIRFGTTSLYPRSRSQYAMLANGTITNPITANDYDPITGFKRLVYANTSLPFGDLGVGGSGDNYITNVTGAPDYDASLLGPLNITLLMSTQSYKPNSGTLEISGASNFGSQTTVRVEGNVKITGNITLDNTGSYSLASLPNVTIIASGDITIDNNVTLVEATLIAGGSLKTCANQPTNQSECNLPLTINGPTRAKDYYLYRTNTTSMTDTKASENFLFPPSAIMAPYARGTGSVVPTTEYETELPPRY